MPEEPLPNRQSIRLKGWDYTAPGWYFLTFNTKARRPVFGTIVNGRMALNAAGRIAAEEWQKSATLRPNLALDEFVVMPDHVHGIVRDDLALARIRAYIRDNPRNAHAVLQSGPPRLLGNPALLQRPRLGFLASRGDATPHGKLPLQPGEAILSGFLSNSTRLVVGHLNPDGMLACLLCETPPELEIQYLN